MKKKILVKKVYTVDDLAGIIHDVAFKDKTIDEINKLEKKAIDEGYIERYLKSSS
jgi:hypothetical protein